MIYDFARGVPRIFKTRGVILFSIHFLNELYKLHLPCFPAKSLTHGRMNIVLVFTMKRKQMIKIYGAFNVIVYSTIRRAATITNVSLSIIQKVKSKEFMNWLIMNTQNELLIYWYSSQVNQRYSDAKGSTKFYPCTISSVCTLYRGVHVNESLGRVLVVKARPFDKKIRYLVFRVYNTVEDIAKIQLTFLQQLSHIYIHV